VLGGQKKKQSYPLHELEELIGITQRLCGSEPTTKRTIEIEEVLLGRLWHLKDVM